MEVQPNGSYIKIYTDGSVAIGSVGSKEYTLIQPDGSEITINDSSESADTKKSDR